MNLSRAPYAQPLTLDFNLVTVRNAERALRLLGLDTLLADLRAQIAALQSSVPAHTHALSQIYADADWGMSDFRLRGLAPPLGAQDAATKDYVDAHAGGGPGASVIVGQASVDFGAQEAALATVTVSELSVATGMRVLVVVAATATPDHDAEDAFVEGLVVAASEVTPGVGFDLHVHAPDGTWGRYQLNYLIA